MTPPGPPPDKQLGTARPTCERCGKELEIEILGKPDPQDPTGGDITRVTFKMPARHSCRPPSNGAGSIDLREVRPRAAGAP